MVLMIIANDNQSPTTSVKISNTSLHLLDRVEVVAAVGNLGVQQLDQLVSDLQDFDQNTVMRMCRKSNQKTIITFQPLPHLRYVAHRFVLLDSPLQDRARPPVALR